MVDSLNNTTAWIQNIYHELARLKSGAFLEQSSISDGQMRFIRSTLLLQGAALLKGEGTFDWTGPGSIAGNFEVLDGGVIKVGGVLISPVGGGRIMIGQGPVGIILDGATGSLTMGDVRIEGNRIFVGGMELDPTSNGGSIKFPDGPEVYADGTTLALYSVGTGAFIEVGKDELNVRGPGLQGITVTAEGMKLDAVPTRPNGDGIRWYGEDADGFLVKVNPGTGGPVGSLMWVFPPSTVTSEYGPREVTIEGASAFHEGIDHGVDEGTPIPAAGAGTVTTAGPSGGYGNLVVIDHGGGLVTKYAHMQTLPYVAVGQAVPRGHILGPVGNTGVSGAPHLHFEVHVNGQAVNPRSRLPAA